MFSNYSMLFVSYVLFSVLHLRLLNKRTRNIELILLKCYVINDKKPYFWHTYLHNVLAHSTIPLYHRVGSAEAVAGPHTQQYYSSNCETVTANTTDSWCCSCRHTHILFSLLYPYINGIGRKQQELKHLLHKQHINIPVIQVTKLTTKFNTPKFPGYTTLNHTRPNNDDSGGLITLIHNSVHFVKTTASTRAQLPADNTLEIQSIRISPHKQDIKHREHIHTAIRLVSCSIHA